MSQFKSEDELKTEAADAKKHLLREKQRTKKLRDSAKHQVAILGQAFDKRKKVATTPLRLSRCLDMSCAPSFVLYLFLPLNTQRSSSFKVLICCWKLRRS